MNSGRCVLSQVLDLAHRQPLARFIERYNAESCVRHFGCRKQLVSIAFARPTCREGLCDIAACLQAKPEALCHSDFREAAAKSTLAEANETRSRYLRGDLAKTLMRKTRTLYAGEGLWLDLAKTNGRLSHSGYPSLATDPAGHLAKSLAAFERSPV